MLALWSVYRVDHGRAVARSTTRGGAQELGDKDEGTQVEESHAAPLRLAATPARFDDMGRLLQSLGEGYQYRTIAEAALELPATLADIDVLFLTCAEFQEGGAAAPSQLPRNLREFVGRGGTLYASDLRFEALAAAFPEAVDARAVAQGQKQDLTAEVIEPGLRELIGSQLPLHFDLEGWRPAAFGGREATTYLRGTCNTNAGVSLPVPLLVKFPFQDGTVVFTSFHNEKQNNDVEIQLLKYLVFTTVTAKVETRVTKTMRSGGFSPQAHSLLSATPEKPSVTHTFQHGETGDVTFVLGFERRGARLRLEVTAPDGKRLTEAGEETISLAIPQAAPGTWRYTVAAEKLPYPNFPFTVTVGAVSQEAAKLAAKAPAEQGAEPAMGSVNLTPGAKIDFREIKLMLEAPAKHRRIAVTPPAFDNMGRLLDKLGAGYPYDTLPLDDLSRPGTLDGYDVLFLTCARSDAGSAALRGNLRRFVDRGGTLYASDLRYPMVAATFPEAVRGETEPRRDTGKQELQAAQDALDALQASLDDMTNVAPLAEGLKAAGLTPPVAEHWEEVAGALQKAGMTEGVRHPTTIRKTLSAAGLANVPDRDLEAIAQVLRQRTLEVSRAKQERRKDKELMARIAAAKQRVQAAESALKPPPNRDLAAQLGAAQHVTASVVEPGLREILGDAMPLNFNVGGWAPAQFAGPGVTVYLRGGYQTVSKDRAEAALLVKFVCGSGTVIFTSFHNEAQNSEQEDKLLRYLVFTAVTAKQEALVAKTMVSGGFSPAQKSLHSHSSGNPTITQTYRNSKTGRLQFALAFAGEGARLQFKIVAPNGQLFEKVASQAFIVEVPEAPLGEWRYTVTALQVPYENFPFTVDVGEETPSSSP